MEYPSHVKLEPTQRRIWPEIGNALDGHGSLFMGVSCHHFEASRAFLIL